MTIFAANWKLHLSPDEARAFVARCLPQVPPRAGRTIAFFPTAVSLEATAKALAGRQDVTVGAQDVYWEPKGAFTGATSPVLAAGAGATAALIGHSERRHVFGESDHEVRRKLVAVLAAGLRPFLCVGETLAQREAGTTDQVVVGQLKAACAGVGAAGMARLVLAYEPVWAIGTGRNATPEDAAAVHAVLSRALAELGGPEAPVIYGGSVNPANARALLSRPEIHGVLVGGASLDPDTWARLIAEGDEDHVLRNLPTKRVEADEIWAFVGAKQKRAQRDGDGDVWTFTAIDADSKLMISWLVGERNAEAATAFMQDVASRLAHRVQLTTDGHSMYLTAVERAFGWNGVDFAQLVKSYGHAEGTEGQRRYSPPVCTGATKHWVMGKPDETLVSTSYVERSNLTLRMQQRRFTRLTNAAGPTS